MDKALILQGFFSFFLHFDSANSFANGGKPLSAKRASKSVKIPAFRRGKQGNETHFSRSAFAWQLTCLRGRGLMRGAKLVARVSPDLSGPYRRLPVGRASRPLVGSAASRPYSNFAERAGSARRADHSQQPRVGVPPLGGFCILHFAF